VSSGTPEQAFETYLEEAIGTPFSGWDFTQITAAGRMLEAPLRWNYYNVVLPWLRSAETMLDMGTGGGEVFARFAPLPRHTYASEQHRPNVAIARERLEPLGVTVVEVGPQDNENNQSLPFGNEFFDLILSRHEAYSPAELTRILKPGGTFITQQVGSMSVLSLRQFLTERDETVEAWNLNHAARELESAGFSILDQQEDTRFYRFYDVGAVAYFMKAIPWIIEDFSIERYRGRLWDLHLRIQRDGFYDTPQHRFIIVAQNRKTG